MMDAMLSLVEAMRIAEGLWFRLEKHCIQDEYPSRHGYLVHAGDDVLHCTVRAGELHLYPSCGGDRAAWTMKMDGTGLWQGTMYPAHDSEDERMDELTDELICETIGFENSKIEEVEHE